ncbi:DNA/RNA non-specific endonuclease, partial [Ralstonia solanacearum]
GGVGAAVGEMAGSALAGRGLSTGVQGLVAGTVAGIASGTTAAVMRGGRVQIAQIAADAFGNALGISLAEANAAPTDVLGEKIAELQQSPIWNDPVAPNTDVLGDRIAELQRSPIWNDAGNAVSQAFATSSLGQASAWNRSMESIVPTPQVVGSGVDSAGRAWYQYDDGVTTHAVPAPVLDVQELPPLSKAQLAAAAQSAAVDAGTNAAAMGITPVQVEASIAAGKTGFLDAVSYAGRVALYKGWDFASLGFVERQDARIAANAAGQLSDDNFLKATVTDAVGSVAAFAVAGQVGGFVAGRVGGYAGAAATGAAAAGSYDLTQQAAQNVTYALTDGEAGRNGVSLDELGNSALFGAALGVGGKYLADYGNYNVRLNVGEPGTLYSNPLPFRLEAPEVVASESLNTITSTVGRNTATWTVDASGNPLSVTGTLRESFSGAIRSAAEVRAQSDVAATGVEGDQGGHLIGHRFVLDQGAKNLFPQEGNFNMSAFKTIENDYARYTAQGYQVDFSHALGEFDSITGRPGSVSVNFEVTDANGSLVDTFADKFLNRPGQTYTRRAF